MVNKNKKTQIKGSGRLNHGGWARIEEKQVAVFINGGFRITEASKRRFSRLDLKEEVLWLGERIKVAEGKGWKWVDSSIPTQGGRLRADDHADKEGRFLCVQKFGLRTSNSRKEQ